MVSSHLYSSVTAGAATASMAGRRGKNKVGVATARSEHGVLSGDEWLAGATAGGRECPGPGSEQVREGGREGVREGGGRE